MKIHSLYNLFLESQGVGTDSRAIVPGSIFFALKGSSFNGNVYASRALDEGAAYAVVDEAEYASDKRCILVKDVLLALQQLATHHRRELGLPVLAIAGSNGKTTTKELLNRVLSEKFNVFSTPGNLNNHIGVPLSLLRLKAGHDIAVIELGANHRGENRLLAEISCPDYGIVTNVGKDHLEGFGGVEGVKLANKELYDYLAENGGTAFVNRDDKDLVKLAGTVQAVYYGTDSGSAYQGKILDRFPFLKAELNFHGKEKVNVETHLFGSFHLENIMAAAAIGDYFKVMPAEIAHAISSYIPDNNRSQILEWGGNKIIMDAYNANPSSMQGALADFSDYPHAHKIVVLGDMHELGEESQKEHEAIVAQLKASDFRQIILVGPEFEKTKSDLNCLHFLSVNELKNWLYEQEFSNALFFVKGSRGQKLEKAFG